MTQLRCPVCGHQHLVNVVNIEDTPVHCNVLHPSAEQARFAPKASMNLVSCRNCQHLFNQAFDIKKVAYAPGYDASLYFSATYQRYAEKTAKALIERHQLRQKTVLEIGCGDGRYLELMCRLGSNKGVGLDPGCHFDAAASDSQICFSSDYFDRGAATYQPDFLLCRHVLEHLEQPRSLVEDAYYTLVNCTGGGVYFEVPNANYTLLDLGIWDLIYEHFSYFTPQSLALLFTQAGFQIARMESAYGNQFLCLEAIASHASHVELCNQQAPERLPKSEHQRRLNDFSQEFKLKCHEWRERLSQLRQLGERVVLWGTGSKGVTFLNIIDSDQTIEYVIDINPGKTGKYVAGTGHQVMSPDEVKHRPPKHVLVMNPVYFDEIESALKERNVDAQIYMV